MERSTFQFPPTQQNNFYPGHGPGSHGAPFLRTSQSVDSFSAPSNPLQDQQDHSPHSMPYQAVSTHAMTGPMVSTAPPTMHVNQDVSPMDDLSPASPLSTTHRSYTMPLLPMPQASKGQLPGPQGPNRSFGGPATEPPHTQQRRVSEVTHRRASISTSKPRATSMSAGSGEPGKAGAGSQPPPERDADGKFRCQDCNKTYLHAKHLKRHSLRHSGARPYQCPLCRDTFSRSDILKRHFQKCSVRRGNPTNATHLSHTHANREAAAAAARARTASDTPHVPPISTSFKSGTMKGVERSCDQCMGQKTSCDSNQPCGHCQSKNIDCTYHKIQKRHSIASGMPPVREIPSQQSYSADGGFHYRGSIGSLPNSLFPPQEYVTSPGAFGLMSPVENQNSQLHNPPYNTSPLPISPMTQRSQSSSFSPSQHGHNDVDWSSFVPQPSNPSPYVNANYFQSPTTTTGATMPPLVTARPSYQSEQYNRRLSQPWSRAPELDKLSAPTTTTQY